MTEQNNQNNDVFIAEPTEGTAIREETYKNWMELVHVRIADGVTVIGREAFSGCTGLISVGIPGSVTKIGGFAFCGCTGLTHVTMSKNTAYGGSTFARCSNLTIERI